MDHIGHHSPDMDVLMLGDVYFRIVWIFWHKQNPTFPPDEPLDRQLTVQGGNNHLIVACRDDPIDHQKVTIKDSCIDHGLPAGTQKKGCGFVPDQMIVEVEWTVHVVFGRGKGIPPAQG